jgi:hypothetical protein
MFSKYNIPTLVSLHYVFLYIWMLLQPTLVRQGVANRRSLFVEDGSGVLREGRIPKSRAPNGYPMCETGGEDAVRLAMTDTNATLH